MRKILIVLFAALATSCKTSSLGSCSSDTDCSSSAMCDAVQRVCIQTDAPEISNVQVTTPAGYTAPDGGLFFDTAGSPLAVSATVTPRGDAGVDAASVCLRVTGETGSCAHPGTADAGNAFTFALPRAAGPADGKVVGFQISAAGASGHSALSPVQQVSFDDQPPSVSISADPAAYARALPDGGTAPAIAVSATVVDAVGVPAPELLSGGTAIPPSSSSGNTYVFQLDPRDAPAGVEGAYPIHVRAVDRLGHDGGADAVRFVDDAAPDASVRVFKGNVDPGTVGVTYPATVPNTGWTGNSFVYSDIVHVKGTITDLGGIGSAALHIDGIELDGGVSAGTAQALGCVATETVCNFDVQVALNGPQNGAFHTGPNGFAISGSALIPSGMLHVVVEATDAVVAGGVPAGKTTRSDMPARATRFLWSTTLLTNPGGGGTAVTGLAIHPNDSVIASTDGGVKTVFELSRGDGGIVWSSDAGTVLGPPAIGSGAADAPIYTANLVPTTNNGFITAFSANDGGVLWNATGAAFSVGPAVAHSVVSGNAVDQVLVPGNTGGVNALYSVTAPGNVATVTSQTSAARDRHASPSVFDGGVFFGTANGVDWHPAPGDGTIGASVAVTTSLGPSYYGTSTDGTRVFAPSRPAAPEAELHAIDPQLGSSWIYTYDGGIAPAAEATLGPDGKLYVSDTDGGVTRYDPADGGNSGAFVGFANEVPFIPLHGSGGRWYLTAAAGANYSLRASVGGEVSWVFFPTGTLLRGTAMDCEGRLFVGTGALQNSPVVVWAFVTDDQGLANTKWPSWRGNARNTGNAADEYGIRAADGGCAQ